jgi:hypothetical protein
VTIHEAGRPDTVRPEERNEARDRRREPVGRERRGPEEGELRLTRSIRLGGEGERDDRRAGRARFEF